MTIDNFNLQTLAIECINKTAADKMGGVQIAMGMGLMNNDETEGYTATYHMNEIEKEILRNGYAKRAGMTWTIETETTEDGTYTEEFFKVA